MGSIFREMLGITPNVKIVSQMNEKLKNDKLSDNSDNKKFCNSSLDMISIPITTPIGIGSTQKLASKWEWTGFNNNARTDSLMLFHWSKVQSQRLQNSISALNCETNVCNKSRIKDNYSTPIILEEDSKKDNAFHGYYFSKFNRHPTVYGFQSEQYNKYIKDIDPDWSEEDTRILFDLCKEFDLRFIIIHDRYTPLTGKQRTLEQLKQRYYSVSKKLVELNFDSKRRALGNSPDPSALSTLKEERNRHPYLRYSYNFEQDRNRRIALFESYNEGNARKSAKKIIKDIQPKFNQLNNKKGGGQAFKVISEFFDLEQEIDLECKFVAKLKSHESLGPKKSGVTTAGALCYQYISSLPRKFSSDVENFLKHFKLDLFPLPFLTTEVAEQYCAMRCDLLILLSTRKKLQRLNSFKHAWQEKLRNAILQNDEFVQGSQIETEEKSRNQHLINSSSRQYNNSSSLTSVNAPRNVTRPRGKSIRTAQEQNVPNQVPIAEINTPGISQYTHGSVESLKRDVELTEKPKKRSKSNISRFIPQQNGQMNLHTSSMQIDNLIIHGDAN
ncbi:homeodomain-like containing protein [Cryptosporidium felis]|nr:homeodomain-like containing protein [Cryptosporidium felis]